MGYWAILPIMAQIQNYPIVIYIYITESITNQWFLCFSKSESPYLELFILVVLFHAFNLNVALDRAFFVNISPFYGQVYLERGMCRMCRCQICT